ncbi:MAG: hypothetical protein Q4B26_16575 [Eubacteriales bacterium]|nr:hypothetical protein [Eubacteriales bacterium]
MAQTDWVFPETGYTCKQDERALYEINAPASAGATDNRSRVAEPVILSEAMVLPHSCVASRKMANRKGITHMRPCLEAKEIKREIKGQLPEIDELIFREHFCAECPYYAGREEKRARCMLKHCAWDVEEEIFSPILRRMIPVIEEEYVKAEEEYLELKRRKEIVHKMFEKELLREKRKKDPCYKCAYGKHAPCIGFCYKQMTSHPVDPNAPESEMS